MMKRFYENSSIIDVWLAGRYTSASCTLLKDSPVSREINKLRNIKKYWRLEDISVVSGFVFYFCYLEMLGPNFYFSFTLKRSLALKGSLVNMSTPTCNFRFFHFY